MIELLLPTTSCGTLKIYSRGELVHDDEIDELAPPRPDEGIGTKAWRGTNFTAMTSAMRME